jgi:soluble lytic murein transglycosylase-like protein
VGRLKVLAVVIVVTWIAVASPALAAADPVDRWAVDVAEASARFGISADWIRRVMRAESGGRTMLDGQPVVSRAGAMGLMQLMPGTWRDMRAMLGLGSDPHDPHDNILAGTAYLRLMYDRFGYPGLFAAYNAGPSRYSAYRFTGRRLPVETLAYVAGIAGVRRAPLIGPTQQRDSLFVAASSGLLANAAGGNAAGRSAKLFVALGGGAKR